MGVLYRCFGTTYQSNLQVSRSPQRRLVTLQYTVYIGRYEGSDWFSVSVVPANKVDAVRGRQQEGEKSLTQCCSEVKWPGKVTWPRTPHRSLNANHITAQEVNA